MSLRKRGRPQKNKELKNEQARLKYSLQKQVLVEETPWLNLPDNWFDFEGFVYLVINKQTGKKYIGKKNFWEMRRGKITKESNWRKYKSSSIPLLKDIISLGVSSFEFVILSCQRTKFETYVAEIEEQFKHNVLKEVLPSGEAAYYNDNIMSKFFRPKDFGTLEYKQKCENISKALQEGFSSGRIVHPMKGRIHPNRGKVLPQTGHKKNTGKIWINNGKENKWLLSTESIPEGFVKGLLNFKKRSVKS